MKPQLRRLLETMQRYNGADMCREVYGLDTACVYDALVIAPSWLPTRLIHDPSFRVTELTKHVCEQGFLVEKDDLKIAWAQCGCGACNLIDHLTICAELSFKKLIFIGAVGSLVSEIPVGELCTPSESIDGSFASAYLQERLDAWQPFERVMPSDAAFVRRVAGMVQSRGWTLRQAPVFCTDSISLEYAHLDQIKAMGAQLIEMETAAFYRLAGLLEVPAAALLVVSDNSASGDPLLGKREEQGKRYHDARSVIIPELIAAIAADR